MRKFLLLAAGLLLTVGLFSQVIVYTDNFESYTVGEYLATQSDSWTTWSNDPGSAEDALLTDEQALSGTQSVKVDGIVDLVKPLGDKLTGKYSVEISFFIAAGYGGYFNLQKFESPGTEWGVQTYFVSDGTGSIDAGAEGAGTFTYTPDSWVHTQTIVDLDNDWAECWVNGELIIAWPWTLGTFGDPGALQLGGINIYAGTFAGSGDDPLFYFDDVHIEKLDNAFYEDDFEDYAVGDFIGIVQPDWWTTWGLAPGTPEDAYISDTYASSPTQSLFVDPDDGLTDLVLKLGDKTSGAYEVTWNMYVESGYNGYYNFQHFESPGTEWAFDIWFNDGGVGDFMVGDVNYAFTFPMDTWYEVKHIINIDGDWAEFYVDGVKVHGWPFHYETSGTEGTNQLGGVDFWTDDLTYKYYIDDVLYKPIAIDLYVEPFEDYALLDWIGVVQPDWWTTWGQAPGTPEDAYIVDTYANMGTQSLYIDPNDGLTDLVLKLGDKTSGAYDVNWYMYVPSGLNGYYNFQHFESPGTEWAFDIWFYDGGAGELMVGDVIYNFTFPNDTWFSVEHNINIDDDWCVFTCDGNMVHAWPFHYESAGTEGTNQLGGVDIWTDDTTYDFYIDDVVVKQYPGVVQPGIETNPNNFTQVLEQGATATKTLNIKNTGNADLMYELHMIHNLPGDNAPVSIGSVANTFKTATLGTGAMEDPTPNPAKENPASDDEFVLHYDGDNGSAIGWNSPPITPTVAAMFPTMLTIPHAGMVIESIDLYVNDDGGTDFAIRIYKMGKSYEPGEMIYEQAFTGIALSWNHVVLDSPVAITGEDIWVGYTFTQPVADIFIPGTDAGPADPNGDFISTGVGWNHLSDNPELNYNWNIRANLTGDPIPTWLTFDPYMGTILPGENIDVDVIFNATGMSEGSHSAFIRVISNDPDNGSYDIPATMAVLPGGGTPESVCIDFEDQEDFSLIFGDWTAVDVDGAVTYGFDGIEFANQYDPMAFIAFNPSTTTPPMTDDPEIQPYDGVRFGACFASVPPPTNDDWLISPQIALGESSTMTFQVKSYTADYGLEQYKVGVSTTGMDPADFTIITGDDPMLAPADAWTEVNLDLGDYDGETVYVGLQCVSEDAWIFMVDNICIDFLVGIPDAPSMESVVNVFPNPANDYLNIVSSDEMTQIDCYNYVGQRVFSSVVKDNNYRLNTSSFQSGMYYVTIRTAEGMTTKKVLIN